MLENEFSTVEKVGNIIYGTFKKNLIIDIEAARTIVRDRMKITQGIPHYLILDATGVISVTKEAREYLASVEAAEDLAAGAIIIKSPISTFLGNFFLKINNPPKPSRLFTNKKDALYWINKLNQ